MSRIQIAARGGGECARIGALRNIGCAEIATTSESITGRATNPTTSGFASPFWESGCETGLVFFLEVAQQVLFAQQLILHAFSLGAFERMQDGAGS